MPCPSSPSDDAGWNEPPVGPDWAAPIAPTYFNYAQGLDLRRLERDPAQHHRQGDPGALWSEMDFDLSEEQRLLADSVARLMEDDATASRARKAYQPSPHGLEPRSCGANTPSSGLLGAPFAEEDGGFGGGAVETMIVMEAFGRALALEPYLADSGAGGRPDAPRRRPPSSAPTLVRAIAAGDLRLALRACRAAIGLRSRSMSRPTRTQGRRRLRARRRKGAGAARRQRRQADRLGARRRAAARPRRHRPVPGRRQARRA